MSIGIYQVLIILVIVFVIFGAGKLPSVMGDIGKGVRNLKDGMKSDDSEASQKTIAENTAADTKETDA